MLHQWSLRMLVLVEQSFNYWYDKAALKGVLNVKLAHCRAWIPLSSDDDYPIVSDCKQ